MTHTIETRMPADEYRRRLRVARHGRFRFKVETLQSRARAKVDAMRRDAILERDIKSAACRAIAESRRDRSRRPGIFSRIINRYRHSESTIGLVWAIPLLAIVLSDHIAGQLFRVATVGFWAAFLFGADESFLRAVVEWHLWSLPF